MHVMAHASAGLHCGCYRAPHGGNSVGAFLHICHQLCHMRGSARMSQVLICSQDKNAWRRKGQGNKACWCPAAALLLVLAAFSLLQYHLCFIFYSPQTHTQTSVMAGFNSFQIDPTRWKCSEHEKLFISQL